MKKASVFIWVFIALYGVGLNRGIADEASGEERKTFSEWKWRAAVEVEGDPEEGLVEFEVTPEVFDRAREDFADLRVVAGRDVLPWVLRKPRGSSRTKRLECEMYNRTNIPGQMDRVMVKFEEEVMKDSIRIVTSGENYKRPVTVEASQDGQGWELLQDGRFLFDISTPAGGRHQKSRIDLPRNNFQYLRITVHHDPDDPEEISIDDVRSYRTTGEPAPVESVDVKSISTRAGAHDTTLLNVDLGHKNLPLRKMTVDVEDRNFHRHVTIRGRNRVKRQVKRRMESGAERTRTVREPWKPVGQGNIYRYSSGGASDESLEIDLRDCRYRYIQLEIHNEDNPPLKPAGVSVDRYRTYVAFQPRESQPWWVYLGNDGATMPDYDLSHYADRLRSEGVTQASLSAPDQWGVEEPDTPPWSEQYRWVLWVVLLMAITAVGWMVWRQAQAGAQEG
ncbi:MAG: DUF3999 family protein [Candidatus Brocadiia bacterium]